MSAFGDRLREVREDQGHSLEAVAEATRIVVRHLEALERSDVQALPAGPFARGYIEAYAQFLGIDPEPILKRYRAEGHRRGLDVAETRDRVYEEFTQILEERARTRQGLGWKGLLLVLVVTALVGLGVWLLARSPRSDFAPTRIPPREARSRGSTPPPDVPDAIPAPHGAETGAHTGTGTSADEAVGDIEPTAEAGTGTELPETPRSPAELEISHSGVGTGVENNRLVGRADRFTEGTPVVFWTRVVGGRPGDVVRHVWRHEGQTVGFADLRLGGSHWRTYSRRELPEGATGLWVVEARSPEGDLLARHEFLSVPAEGS